MAKKINSTKWTASDGHVWYMRDDGLAVGPEDDDHWRTLMRKDRHVRIDRGKWEPIRSCWDWANEIFEHFFGQGNPDSKVEGSEWRDSDDDEWHLTNSGEAVLLDAEGYVLLRMRADGLYQWSTNTSWEAARERGQQARDGNGELWLREVWEHFFGAQAEAIESARKEWRRDGETWTLDPKDPDALVSTKGGYESRWLGKHASLRELYAIWRYLTAPSRTHFSVLPDEQTFEAGGSTWTKGAFHEVLWHSDSEPSFQHFRRCVGRIEYLSGTEWRPLKEGDGLGSLEAIEHFWPSTPAPDNSEGRKDDQAKTRVDLLPFDTLLEVTKVLDFGAKKYADRNWEKGMAWHRPFGALMRHMWAWWTGEEKDPETGLSHLAHAACCVLFLLTYELRQIGTDDRPTTPRRST